MIAHDTPIPTPSGWATLSTLRVGDLAFALDGRPVPITAFGPWELDPISYRLTFDDGAAVEVAASQQWLTMNAAERKQLNGRVAGTHPPRGSSLKQPPEGQRPLTPGQIRARSALGAISLRRRLEAPTESPRTTEEIAATLTAGNGFTLNHRLPVASPLELPAVPEPLAPYLLGKHIGDSVSPYGERIIEGGTVRVLRVAGEHFTRPPRLCRSTSSSATFDLLATYLRASLPQRTALLQGLMDAAGGFDCRGRCVFWCEHPELADDIHDLVAGLGYKPSLDTALPRPSERLYAQRTIVAWNHRPDRPVPFRDESALAELPARPHPKHRWRYLAECHRIPPLPMRTIAVEGGTLLIGRSMIPTIAMHR